MGLIEFFHETYIHKRRISALCDWCVRLIPLNSKVLDVGCGDGQLTRLIANKRPDVSIFGIDVLQRPKATMPVETFDGNSIPYDDSSFDVLMFVDVLHHTEQPMTLLREAVRVARRAILIKDHLPEGILADPILRLMDWIGNARHGVSLPYNYWTRAEWQQALCKLGLNINSWETNLRLYPVPADLILGRSLHFITLLELIGSAKE
jgi:SAM-dependent methyltransferase